MKDKVKDKILVVSIILMIGAILMTLSSNQVTSKFHQELDQERYKRLVAEENLSKAATKISSLESELSGTREKIQSVQAILQEGKAQANDLKSQLDSVVSAKATLEKKIEELKKDQAAQVKAATPEQTP